MTLPGLSVLQAPIEITRDVVLLPARGSIEQMLPPLSQVTAQSPWRQMKVPGGKRMSVANTNCGELGWTSDAHGYRYRALDPISQQPWPPMPDAWKALAKAWSLEAGFEPALDADACLINGYATGAKLSAHQDRDEASTEWPIVSLSLGAPARFVMGGAGRGDKGIPILLTSGDVLVWGRSARLNFHGVGVPRRERVAGDAAHLALPYPRLNFTFRRAG